MAIWKRWNLAYKPSNILPNTEENTWPAYLVLYHTGRLKFTLFERKGSERSWAKLSSNMVEAEEIYRWLSDLAYWDAESIHDRLKSAGFRVS